MHCAPRASASVAFHPCCRCQIDVGTRWLCCVITMASLQGLFSVLFLQAVESKGSRASHPSTLGRPMLASDKGQQGSLEWAMGGSHSPVVPAVVSPLERRCGCSHLMYQRDPASSSTEAEGKAWSVRKQCRSFRLFPMPHLHAVMASWGWLLA